MFPPVTRISRSKHLASVQVGRFYPCSGPQNTRRHLIRKGLNNEIRLKTLLEGDDMCLVYSSKEAPGSANPVGKNAILFASAPVGVADGEQPLMTTHRTIYLGQQQPYCGSIRFYRHNFVCCLLVSDLPLCSQSKSPDGN